MLILRTCDYVIVIKLRIKLNRNITLDYLGMHIGIRRVSVSEGGRRCQNDSS